MRLPQLAFSAIPCLALTVTAPTLAPATENEPKTLQVEVRQLGERLTRDHRVPGLAVGLIRQGEIQWIEGIGFADLQSQTPVTENTVFNVGSISKCVASWGVMRLVERRQVELDRPVEDYLRRWKLPASKFGSEGVTLRRILSHTAGISLPSYPGFSNPKSVPTLEQSLSGSTGGVGRVRVTRQPGSRYEYSGGGYTIAQLLVEERSGDEFAKYMKQHVLDPLEMTSSHFGWTNSLEAATPYDRRGKPIAPVRFAALAAAGLETTCADLTKFAVASMSDSNPVLQRSTVQLMQTKVEPGGATRSGGLGYQHMKLGPTSVVGHLGSNRGWEAAMMLRPDSGDGLVMLTNGSNGQSVQRPIYAAWTRSLAKGGRTKPTS